MKKHCLLIAFNIGLMMTQAYAQVQDISTDRPDQANTPVLVPKGALQIETGVIIEKDNTGGEEYFNYGYNNSLLKFGVNENFEVRFGFAYVGVKYVSGGLPVRRGFGPLAIGVKIKLADQDDKWPQAALITNVTLKTGTEEFQPPFTSTDITLAFSRTFGHKLTLAVNSGVKWDGNSPEAIWLYALSVAYNITRDLAMFVESYGFLPEAHASDHRADGGITYKISPRLQFDASGGLGVSENSNQLFISTGISVRLLK